MISAKPHVRKGARRWRVYGQGLVEYALILALMVIVVLIVVAYLGQIVADNMYSKISSGFPG